MPGCTNNMLPVALRGVLNGEGASATTAPKCTKVRDEPNAAPQPLSRLSAGIAGAQRAAQEDLWPRRYLGCPGGRWRPGEESVVEEKQLPSLLGFGGVRRRRGRRRAAGALPTYLLTYSLTYFLLQIV